MVAFCIDSRGRVGGSEEKYAVVVSIVIVEAPSSSSSQSSGGAASSEYQLHVVLVKVVSVMLLVSINYM